MKKFELTEKTLRNIERPSANVSDKYVPIYTSHIVEALKPEFSFDYGYQFGKTSSKHYVQLKNKDQDVIRVYNSFDRTFALRIYFISDDLQFPLVDQGRVVHIGEKARNVEDLKELKAEILKSIPAIKELKAKLQDEKVTKLDTEIIKEINKIIPEDVLYRTEYNIRNRKGDKKSDLKLEFVNYVDTVAKKAQENGKPLSLYNYINLSVRNYVDGNYGIKQTYKGVETLKGGRKIVSPFTRTRTLFRINNQLQEVLPEYFI